MTPPLRVAALLVSGLLVAGCAQSGGGAGATGRWQQLPPVPVAPRLGAVTAWTGTEALFLGGDGGQPCPPNASCAGARAGARTGAAYDPALGTWRRTADAPVPIAPFATSAVLGDAVFVLTAGQLLSYDAADDAWSTHALPAGGLDGAQLASDGSGVIAWDGERRTGSRPDELYDPAARRWRPVPQDPMGPAFDRVYVGTTAGFVLTDKEWVTAPGVRPAVVRAAVLDPGPLRWIRLPDTGQIGGWHWSWTGRRLVDAQLGGADGGATDSYGRTYPFGGVLDVARATWSPLPHVPDTSPDPGSGGWPVEALGGPLTALGGWVYDDRVESWTALPTPDGAPSRPGSAVWAGDRLVVLGGADFDGAGHGTLSPGAWIYDPAPDD